MADVVRLNERFEASLTDAGQYRLLVDAMTDYAIYMLDTTGVVTSWNPGARRLMGYEATEIIGKHFSIFYSDEDRRNGLPARALETTARKDRFESEGWRICKDGSRIWAHVVIDQIRDPSGRLMGFAKITRDLTERRQTKAALRQFEQQFKALVQGVIEYAIYMLDPNGNVITWNTGAQRIKGYRPEEIIGRHFSAFYTEADRRAGKPQQALEAARLGSCADEGWRVRKDGTRFWASVVINPIQNDNASIVGFAKVTRDISASKALQLSLDQAREALFQSQRMEAIGQLTGGIAHDFNNILMAILGGLELVRKRAPENPRTTPLIDNAIEAAQRGHSLTQRMLTFARRQELKPEAVDLSVLVHGMIGLLQRTLGPSVTLETRFKMPLDAVKIDADQLELALLNLALNARDAMPEGGPIIIEAQEVEVSPGHSSKLGPGRYICLSVTDLGEGMDQMTLSRVVEPFFTTKEVGKGTGLGLSMVHGLAEQSGGRLILKSQKHKGTTAELWLPAATAGSEDAVGDRQPDPGDPAGAMRALVVLSVDGDSTGLTNTTSMLKGLGHTVLEATTGAQALAIIRRENAIDLVVIDHALSEMTAAQLVEAIRTEWPNLPIILATPLADTGLSMLGKPFRQLDLMRVIVDLRTRGRLVLH